MATDIQKQDNIYKIDKYVAYQETNLYNYT